MIMNPNPLPIPVHDAGVLCVILSNTAISKYVVKEIFRSILHLIGILFESWEELSENTLDSYECCKTPSDSYVEEFRSQIPAMRFNSLSILDSECSKCLSEFEPDSEDYAEYSSICRNSQKMNRISVQFTEQAQRLHRRKELPKFRKIPRFQKNSRPVRVLRPGVCLMQKNSFRFKIQRFLNGIVLGLAV
ncbi:hypothetical protein ACS0TY_021802 [Phlomoides rotata]